MTASEVIMAVILVGLAGSVVVGVLTLIVGGLAVLFGYHDDTKEDVK